MSDLIKVEVTDGIQIITINRPEAKNAINLETAQALAAALDQLDGSDDIRIGILTGAGARSVRAWTSRPSPPPASAPTWTAAVSAVWPNARPRSR